jgi:UDP-glucose 4-epimerase
MRILVTGANGFVGHALCKALHQSSHQVRTAIRSANKHQESPDQVLVGDIIATTQWEQALQDINVVIHLAARVHVMNDQAVDPLSEFRKVNVDGTLNLARQAAMAGVKRFIFISSIKVNGESTAANHPFSADDIPAPVDAYGISKREAEDALRLLAEETGLEVVIIRPPLVYGPGVKANFLTMMRWLHKGLPLPLGSIDNKRSLVALDNLVDLLVACVDHPAAANQTFLVSDDEDLSTSDLLRRMAKVLGKTAWLLPFPGWLLTPIAGLIGKKAVAQRLCYSLQVDITKTRHLLNWTPPINVDEGLRQAAQQY